MATIDSLSLNKNLTYRNISPKNYQLIEGNPTNFFSPIYATKVIKLPPSNNIQNIIKNNNFHIYNQNINIFPQSQYSYHTLNKKTLVLDLDETLVHS